MLKSLSVPHNGTIKPKMFSDIYIYKTDQKQDGTGLVLLQQQNQTGSVNKPVWYTSAEPNQFLPDPALKLSTNLYDILQQNRATSVLILFASCQQTCITYIIAVWTVKNSWWWTEELYEICRILFQKEIWETSTSGWFYCKNLSRCAVPWMSNYLLHFPHIVAIIIKSPALPWGIFFLQVTSAHPLVPCIKKFTVVYRYDWEWRLDRLILFKDISVIAKVVPFLRRLVAWLLSRRPAFGTSLTHVWFKVD